MLKSSINIQTVIDKGVNTAGIYNDGDLTIAVFKVTLKSQ